MQDALVIADRDAAITYWNHAAERIFGYPADEALGRRLVCRDDRVRVLRAIARDVLDGFADAVYGPHGDDRIEEFLSVVVGSHCLDARIGSLGRRIPANLRARLIRRRPGLRARTHVRMQQTAAPAMR